MTNWILNHLDVLVTTAWAIKELWTAKGSKKRKAIETARELDAAAHKLELLQASKSIQESLDSIMDVADAAPDLADEWRAKLNAAEAKLLARRSPEAPAL